MRSAVLTTSAYLILLRFWHAGETVPTPMGEMEIGCAWFWLAMIGTWASDTFAYFSGFAFGKTKLCEELSPKKTREGFYGGVVGTALDLDGRFNRLVNSRNKAKGKGADGQASSESSDLGRGLSTAIMLFCVGTLSILGPINSALYGDETFLFTNAMLDLVTSMVLASTCGYGIAIAAAVLFCWQGGIFLLASFLSPLLSSGLMCEISIVGGFLIFASGLSILKIREISTMNLLPGLFVPPIWFALLSLAGSLGFAL